MMGLYPPSAPHPARPQFLRHRCSAVRGPLERAAAADAVQHLVDLVRREVHLVLRVLEGCPDAGIDQHAQVRLVYLDYGNAGACQQFDFLAQDRHQSVDERVAGRVGGGGQLRVPQPHSQ